MGNKSIKSIGYRDTLDKLVVALCKDYYARHEAILMGKCSKRTLMEYEYINRKINEAAIEVAEDDYELFIKEIGDSRGYARSKVFDISESTYKRKKQEIKINIARKLNLID